MPERIAGGVAGVIVLLASVLCPADRRGEWRREWAGELDAAAPGRRRLALSLGALPDAWALRRLDGPQRQSGTESSGGGAMNAGEPIREVSRAGRSLLRAPGFTVAAVATLGLGLGATAAIFTLANAILLRPLPYPESDRLVDLYHSMTAEGSAGVEWPFTLHTYLHFRDESRVLEAVGAHRDPGEYTLRGDDHAELVRGVRVTSSLLDILGARPVLGRLHTSDEDLTGAAPVAVLSHGLWRRRFGGDPSVVGRKIGIGDESAEVIGVMAPGIDLPSAPVELWLPADIDPASRPGDMFRFTVIGRLAAGGDLTAAQADADALTGRLPEIAPFFRIYLDQADLRTHVRPLRAMVIGDVERALWIVLGAVGIVLLVALANVANLFLVRAEGLREEVAVRSALGARRAHLLARFLAESAIISAAAGLVGFALAAGGIGVLVSLAPPSIPRLEGLRTDAATIGSIVVLCIVVALVLGAYPYARFGGTTIGALASRGTAGARDRRQALTGDLLVTGQVALALMLLAGAALLLRSFQNLRSTDVGFDADGILVTDVRLPADPYDSDDAVLGFIGRLEERLRGLPGVRNAAIGSTPLTGRGCSGLYLEGIVVPEGTHPPCVAYTRVGAGWFELLDIPLIAGRTFTHRDVTDRAPVAVINESLARRLWPGQDPIGRGLRPAPRSGPPWYRVIGVVGDVRSSGPHAPPQDLVWYPPSFAHDPEFGAMRFLPVLLEIEPGSDAAVVNALRRAIAELDPDLPLTVDGRLGDAVARSMVRTTFTLFLIGTAAVTALVLAIVGLYGVVAYCVRTRRAEFGIRMAIGASGANIRAMVLKHALRLVLIGAGTGLIGALAATRTLRSMLHGVSAGDPALLALAALAVIATALVATWIPASRATRVDPASSLRAQ